MWPPTSREMCDRAFLRLAGALGALSALTTLLLWLLPRLYAAPASFEDSIALHMNSVYMGRLWVNFVHVALALTAYTAAAALLRRESAALSGAALVWLSIWAAAELGGVAILIFAVNGTWRAGYGAGDEAVQQACRHALDAHAAVWDALFFVILVAFTLGTTFMGAALARGGGLRRTVGVLHLLAGPLTILIILGGYFGAGWASVAAGWVYPVLQPPSRALLGAWIWREAGATEPVHTSI